MCPFPDGGGLDRLGPTTGSVPSLLISSHTEGVSRISALDSATSPTIE